jgi:hypothetical protein
MLKSLRFTSYIQHSCNLYNIIYITLISYLSSFPTYSSSFFLFSFFLSIPYFHSFLCLLFLSTFLPSVINSFLLFFHSPFPTFPFLSYLHPFLPTFIASWNFYMLWQCQLITLMAFANKCQA